MDRLRFFMPVRIVPAPGQPVGEIHTVDDALAFLQNWTMGSEGEVYQTALKHCVGAMIRQVSKDEARKAFADFARAAGIMASSVASGSMAGLAGAKDYPCTK